jgi:DNA-binding NarL/FixJ family response regulator
MKTLIVDDNPMLRQAVREILCVKLPSAKIVEATNGKEALEQFHNHRPEVVFMDIRLPHMNGLAVTRQMKKIFPDGAVIILTNHDIPEYRATAKEYGVDAFLLKGSSMEDEIGAALKALQGVWEKAG